MEEKNFIIFMVVSALLIMAWFFFFAPKPKPKPAIQPVAAGSTVSQKPGQTPAPPRPGSTVNPALTPATGTTAVTSAAGATAVTPAPGTTAEPKVPAAISAELGPKVLVKTAVYEIEFVSLAAAPTHWKLLKYPKEKCFPIRVDIAWPPITRDPPCDSSPVDMVDGQFAAPNYPFSAQVVVDNFTVPIATRWTPENPDLTLGEGSSVGQVSFKTSLPDGRVLHKVYRFRRSRYDVELSFTVEGEKPKSAATDVAMYYVYSSYQKTNAPTWNYKGPEIHDGQRFAQIKPDEVVKTGRVERPGVNWAAFTSEFFLTAVLDEDKSGMTFAVKYLGTDEQKRDKKAGKEMVGWVRMAASDGELAAGEAGRMRLFVGPKDLNILTAVRPSLEKSIDYGTLEILVKPLMTALKMINKVTHNYGWSIVILTFILRMVMFPLTRKSQQSMKEMQKLQPEIQKIREKFPDDRLKQNEEMQALWKRNKINPAMGCLPILLQFPVFIAFYKSLLISIELRQAPFLGWIIDLSARDPLYIWPVAMGVTQLVTQKMTPTQMDPVQAKIFLLMPIIFMYILRDFPSGLLIYWTVQNLVGIAQQVYVNRQTN